MNPNYMQQNFPPHLVDPSAFSHNPYIGTPGLAQNPPLQQPQQFYRPEIYSGTPAPRSPPPMQVPSSPGVSTATAAAGRYGMSMSHGTHSRGGSPDIVNEMNALSRSPGTVNQGGGAMPTTEVHEPVPQRGGIGMDIRRIDLSD